MNEIGVGKGRRNPEKKLHTNQIHTNTMHRFFPKRQTRVYVDAAMNIVKCGALLYVSSKLHDTNYDGPSVAALVEQELCATLAKPIQVFVRVGGLLRTATIRDNLYPVYEVIVRDLGHTNFYMSWCTKPVHSTSNPIELGINQGATILCSIGRVGGMPTVPNAESTQSAMSLVDRNPLFETQSMSVEIENLIIRAQTTDLEWLELPLPLEEIQTLAGLTHEQIVAKIRLFDAEALQADDHSTPEPGADSWRILLHHVRTGLARMESIKIFPGYRGGFTEIFEGLMILRHWHQVCTSATDYWTLARTAYMCFTGKSLPHSIMQRMMPSPELQGFEDIVGAMRTVFDTATTVKDCGVVKRLRKLYTYFLVQGVLSKMGLEATEDEFVFLAKKANAVKYGSKINLWLHVVETTIFICERFVSYRKTGSIDSFFKEGKECEDWLQSANKLLSLAPFTANLEPHGTTYFRFLSDLNDAIERGQGYAKAYRSMGAEKTNPISKQLGALMLLKNAEVTKRASLRSRPAPFGVLVYGHSGVAKSSFMKVLFHAYGSIFGLDRDDHYLFTRSPTDEYWSNFDSSMWAIQMDDIAFMRPTATSDIDPTLKELLNVVNNVPYTPPQADLADKGKTPVLAKLVIATTNCENLNANEYFHCPLAVRRRLPFVVEVQPKREYLQDNGVFIEPTSLPEATPGFPNYWHITVKKLVPHIGVDKREYAETQVVREFDDISEFVRYYGACAKQHVENQCKGEAVEGFVKQVELCPVCCSYKEDCACVTQVDFASLWETSCYYLMWSYVSWLTWWMRFSWVHRACSYLASFRALRGLMTKLVGRYLPAEQFIRFYATASQVVHDNRMKATLAFLSLFAMGLSVYSITRKPKMEPQGNVAGTTEDDFRKEEKTNVWYRDTIELTSWDLPIPSGSLCGKTNAEVRDMFSRNVVNLHIKATDGSYKGYTRGFFYRGTTMMLNAHTLKGSEFDITVLRGERSEGVIPQVTFRVKKTDFVIEDAHDLAAVNVPSMPPARDLSKFWLEDTVPVSKLMGFGRTKAGTVDLRSVWGVNFFLMELKGLVGKFPILTGTCAEDTQSGDCGTLYMVETPRGFAFVGMHVAGYENKAAIMELPRHVMTRVAEQVQETREVISSDGAPLLSLQGAPELLPPHPKSVFRFIEEGSAEFFGRLPGFLPKPRSKVTSTPLRAEMEEHYQMKCAYTRPDMEGWLPIRNNVKEMVVPTVNYDRSILDRCKRAFLKDIVAGLPKGWEGQLVELSDLAAVNGLPGVKFVDKLNTNSSMGFPWNKTKKQFLEPHVSEKYPQGVDFPQDVWDKVRDVEAAYAKGERAYPIFMGHLKDEPVTFAKKNASKTRLFAGGPVHWSIVVRKVLLSFVKLVQENKLTFEAGPGTVCQSIEWQQLREFLTQFGLERIIAGDYSKFDKRMIADFIMAAYWIIAQLHSLAGHDDEMYRKIMGIGNDVAYPVMNIRGELVMFYGTNPSGHPLTVIINSLVNGLYMRYAFASLGYDVEKFKEFVALMTYGDDNAMGVSIHAPRFTHTAVQEVLARIGVVYTMADKESESVPYVHIDSVAFLKRKWRFDGDIGAYVCPLDEDSIQKSLMCWVPSGTICPEAQMVAVIQSAIREYFWYGKETFERKREFFMSHVTRFPYSAYVGEQPLPTWQELKDQFWESSC